MSRDAAFKPLFDMETDIRAERRRAGVLSHLGTSEHTVESEQIDVISKVLFEIGKRLDARWEEAFRAARGKP